VDIHSPHFIFIILAEVIGVLFIVCIFLAVRNRSLKTIAGKLQSRMEQLVKDLRTARAQHKQDKEAAGANANAYKRDIKVQLEKARQHHEQLANGAEIALDIAPETPLPRRVAALRHAILLSEMESVAVNPNNDANWKQIDQKYTQIFSFNSDYAASTDNSSIEHELETLQSDLANAHKRISNLDKFKALYFDLEAKWDACRETAQSQISSLAEIAANSDDAKVLESALQNYHDSYNEFDKLIAEGVEGPSQIADKASDETAGELRHLRSVAADQHKIIKGLQQKLRNASSAEEKDEVVDELQGQLEKQIRFVQESETCIQLLEDELNSSNREIERLRSKATQAIQLKTELKQLRDENDDYEMQVYALKSETRRLASSIKNNAPSSSDDSVNQALKKKLSLAEARYTELEEKFLELKMRQP
jgi:hypothetical protein